MLWGKDLRCGMDAYHIVYCMPRPGRTQILQFQLLHHAFPRIHSSAHFLMYSSNHGQTRNLLPTHVSLFGVTCGSKLTPSPYEKAQTSEEKIYMQAVRSSMQLSAEVLAVHECVVSFLSSSIVRTGRH